MLKNYNPDVLSCLANLSNDEVFTSPQLANQILDLLPEKLFRNKNTTFLDPCCKSGVFLREIAKRLIKGLEKEIPNLQERLNHIYTKQLFAISITELTSLLSRRSVYCSKKANGKYSICNKFKTEQGNILFKRIEHTWKNNKCIYCGASQREYDRDTSLETHAYQFIHTLKPQEIFDMKFDVIVGNPPYQLNDGGAQASASPIYHFFVRQAKKLNPRYLVMIIPARWYAGGKGLDEFRDEMLNDTRIRNLVDYTSSTECFSGVDIQGGVCYFLWDRDNKGNCEIKTISNNNTSVLKRNLLEKGVETFVRYNEAIPILHKVLDRKESSFSNLVSSRKPFGITTDFKDFEEKSFVGAIKIYANKAEGWIEKGLVKVNKEWVSKYKVFVSRAYGMGEFPHLIISKPILGEPKSCCTETYLHIGPFENKKIAENVLSYIKTKFFRFMVLLVKNTQDAPKRVYHFVPIQDFKKEWTDEKLYKKYGLTQEEINFIESMIKPME